MFGDSWKLIKRATLFVGVAMCFFAAIEILHGYQVLSNIDPALGYSFVAIMIAILLALVFTVVRTVVALPRALIPPPPLQSLEDATAADLARYQQYLGAYLARLSRNESISAPQRSLCEQGRGELLRTPRQELLQELARMESNVVAPAVQELEEQANVIVHNCVRDIMLAVSLSPYRAADLLIVVYRNVTMVLQIMRLFYTRPSLRSQFLILRDILSVVAAVNYLNMGEKLIESMAGKIPFLGHAVDDISQGVGAGIMTSTVGHASIERCGAFRGWNPEKGADDMRSKIGRFVLDVGQIWSHDVVGPMRSRLGDHWETVRAGVNESIGSLADSAGRFVKGPTTSVGGLATGSLAVLGSAASAIAAGGTLARRAAGTAGDFAVGSGKAVAASAQLGAHATLRGAQATGLHAAGLAHSAWWGTVQILKTGKSATVGTARATANVAIQTSRSAWRGAEGIRKSITKWVSRGEGDGNLAATVSEQDEAFLVEVSVPGVPKDELHILFEETRLIVRTDADARHPAGACIIDFPESVDSKNASANLEGGILTVRVPKKLGITSSTDVV